MSPAQILDHQFTVAAYIITWSLHLGFLLYLFLKWRSQKRNSSRLGQ